MPLKVRYTALFLAAALLLFISWQSWTVVHFYLHQQAIEQAFCINKDRPEKGCHGKCHLQQQLQPTSSLASEQPVHHSTRGILIFQGFQHLLPYAVADHVRRASSWWHFLDPVASTVVQRLLDPPEGRL